MNSQIVADRSQQHPRFIHILRETGEQIGKLKPPISTAMAKHALGLIETGARMVVEMNLQLWYEGLQQAKATRRFLESCVQGTARQWDSAVADMAAAGSVHTFRLLVLLVCWACCASGEFAFTWSTLPPVLNLEANSFLAIAVSIIPVAALTVLEWILWRAFEEPYQQAVLNLSTMTPQRKQMARGLMAVLLGLLLAGNLYMVCLLAQAREESVHLTELEQRKSSLDLGDDAPSSLQPEVNWKVINDAITVLSLAVVVDGALLFLLGMTDLKNFGHKYRLLLRKAFYGHRRRKQEKDLAQACAEEAAWQEWWDQREARVRAIADDFRQNRLVELQQLLDWIPPKPPEPTLEQMIDQLVAAGTHPHSVAIGEA